MYKRQVLFYVKDEVVKIYEFENADALEKARKENELIKDWPANGKFLLETSDQNAIDIFNGLE